MNTVVFGSTGCIGTGIVEHLLSNGHNVFCAVRSDYIVRSKEVPLLIDVLNNNMGALIQQKKYDCVVFAQGTNLNDSVLSFTEDEHLDMYQVNCLFIIKAMNFLITNNLLAHKANVVVISSIWQEIARQNKMSYMITKSALAGLVRSLAIDLANYNGKQCLVNSILPGALNTPMTHSNLTSEQINLLINQTPAKKLAMVEDIAKMVEFLSTNNGTTGEMINIDCGFNYAKVF